MSVYPATPVPSQGARWQEEYQTALAGPYPGGDSVGTALRSYPLWRVSFGYRYLTDAEKGTIGAFLRSQRGKAGTFTFIDWTAQTWSGMYVAVGSGGATVFDLPSVGTSGLVLRKAGVVLTAGSGYTLGVGTGADGRDRVTLAVHADGSLLEADFVGRLVRKMRFTADTLPFQEGEAGFWSCSQVELLEVP